MNKGGRWELEREAGREEECERYKETDWRRDERERRLDEPWEVLLNCQIATSCELFNVSLRAFVRLCVYVCDHWNFKDPLFGLITS